MALIVALGGTSYAAVVLPRNSVGSSQLKKNAVISSKVKSEAVTSSKVKDRSLLARDFMPGQLVAGHQGPTGATGATGATGPRGPSDLRAAGASGSVSVPTCALNVANCGNLLTRTLGAGTWLIQARISIFNNDNAAASTSNTCGLTGVGATVYDNVGHSLGALGAVGHNEVIGLAAVVSGGADGTTVALRCTEQTGEQLLADDMRITALQVESVVLTP